MAVQLCVSLRLALFRLERCPNMPKYATTLHLRGACCLKKTSPVCICNLLHGSVKRLHNIGPNKESTKRIKSTEKYHKFQKYVKTIIKTLLQMRPDLFDLDQIMMLQKKQCCSLCFSTIFTS